MAFWKYDAFPQKMLCGEVDKFETEGCVSVKGYSGKMFEPIAILPFAEGKKYAEKFEEIKDEYTEKVAKARKEFAKRVRTELPFTKGIHGIT